MKRIVKRVGAFAMAAAVSVSLMGGALAYSTPDFVDVPSDNWAYESVMKMADAGVIAGTGHGLFEPEVKVSPAMWLTLVGRAVYDADVKAATTAEDSWFSAYVRVAETKGLLTGTAITNANIEGELTRYDMAVTLHKAVTLLGVKDVTVDTAAIKDYGDIPQKHLAAVGQVYATGLIAGDSAGNFNGSATMTRAEAAAVMDRLIDLQKKIAPSGPDGPDENGMVTFTVKGQALSDGVPIEGAKVQLHLVRTLRAQSEIVTSGADGWYTIEAAVEAKDYSYTENWYYVTGEYKLPDGTRYEARYRAESGESLLEHQNSMSCNLIKPAPPPPRTGEMVTFTVEGDVYSYDDAYNKVPMHNIGIKFCYEDGRVLAEGVSGADGKFKLTVTVDRADYNEHSSVYYTEARGTDANGKEYWSKSSTPRSLYDTQPWLMSIASGWNIPLYDW